MVLDEKMDVLLRQLFDAGYYDQSPSSSSTYSSPSSIKAESFGCGGDAFEDVFGVPDIYMEMASSDGSSKHGGEHNGGLDEQQQQPWSADPYTTTMEEFNNASQNWDNNNALLPDYLLAGSTRSPIPDIDYQHATAPQDIIKQEPSSPSSGSLATLDAAKAIPSQPHTSARKPAFALPKLRRHSPPTRPLLERQKRYSDEDNESNSSLLSETPTDGTDGSATSACGLPSLPRIPMVSFSDSTTKRQRRDVSMSAPAVAARELRQKKKFREEQLIAECEALKAEAESVEKAAAEAQLQLDKLRADAQYLRSLVRSQHSTVSLLEYLQKAPIFQEGGQKLQLDSRSMLQQISGIDAAALGGKDKHQASEDIGGICLHINGSNITLHMCSHCSSESSVH